MKILVITNDFPPRVGGINSYVAEITKRFPPGEVIVFASSWPGAEAFDATFPHRVVRWPVRTLLPTPRVTEAVSAVVRDERPDILLFGAAVPLALIGVQVRRRFGVPYATFTHGLEIAAARLPVGRSFLRKICHTATLVTVVSHWVGTRLEPFIGPATRLELLPNGVDADAFRPDVSAAVVRQQYGLGDGPVVSSVSRLVARKGQDQVIRALPALAAEWPGIRFLVTGSGPYERTLRQLAERHRVTSHVVFTGHVDDHDLPALFRAGDVFTMPCRSRFGGLETEAFGAVFLQAAAVGRPSIGGRIGGVPEAIQHERTGLLVDGRRAHGVEVALRELLGNPDRARAMGEAGASWVRREHTWELVAARARTLVGACLAG